MFLSSKDNPEAGPQWLTGKGKTEPDPSKGGHSAARSTFIVIEKGERNFGNEWGILDDDAEEFVRGRGIVTDVFYFYFYSFNLGPSVLGMTFGNHVGDW